MRVWDWRSGVFLRQFDQHTIGHGCLAGTGFSVFRDRNGAILVWRWKDGKIVSRLEKHINEIVAIIVQEGFLLPASTDNTLKLWDWRK